MQIPAGIEITRLTGPETGWPFASYCPRCKALVIVWSPWLVKPFEGDFFLTSMCFHENDIVRADHMGMFEMVGLPTAAGA